MGILNFFPGGDSGLNAVAYSSAASIPASADAGTIAVVTSDALGSVYGSATAPVNPAAGDLWILTGASSIAPIALTDEITLYPLLAYQYGGSAWVLREGYVFTGSAWVSLSTHLYEYGQFILASDITTVISHYGSLAKNADNIGITCTRSEGIDGDAHCYGCFDTPINVTNIATIKTYLNHSFSNETGYVMLAVSSDHGATLQASVASTSGGLKTLSLDVAALSGEYYVVLLAVNNGNLYNSVTANFYEVYYET